MGRGSGRVRRRRVPARRAPGPRAGRLGPDDRRPPRASPGPLPDSLYENRYGTVVVRHGGAPYEITAFRRDAAYSDFRHPDAVEFGDSIEQDLARRDFTVNAMAWGGPPGREPEFVDPYGGRDDLGRRLLRAVGAPEERFGEDALRMARAVRLAATLEFEVEAGTLAAIGRNVELARHVSGERLLTELLKLLAAREPSVGLRLMADSGLLAVIAPELDRQRGLGQNKIAGEDLWDHTLRTVDAAPAGQVLRLAALLHDAGKPDTLADGHFHGHEAVGAAIARDFLGRLHARGSCRSEWLTWSCCTCSPTSRTGATPPFAGSSERWARAASTTSWPCERPTTWAAG